MHPPRRTLIALTVAIIVLSSLHFLPAEQAAPAGVKKFTIEQVLAPAYPFELVSAKKADRIAWIAFERGMRNVYTAAAPAFNPVRLTSFLEDDGNDLTSLSISDDGGVCVFVRGHAPNSKGWVANPLSNPQGAERATWAIKTSGGDPWKVVLAANTVLSPDGQNVVFPKDGQIHVSPILPVKRAGPQLTGEKKLFLAHGTNSNPRWSPDSKRVAFVSSRGDHSFIGVYDFDKKNISYVAPGVDHDTSPTWSPDGKQIAFIRRPGTPFGQQKADAKAAGGAKGKKGKAATPPVDPKKDEPAPAKQSPVKGMSKAAFSGGYTYSYWVADVATGKAREFWHDTPATKEFLSVNSIQWVGDSVMFSLEPQQWIRYYSVPLAGNGTSAPVMLTPGEGMVENIALSSDGKTLFYCTNAGDIDRRHVWKVPTSGGKSEQITTGTDIETYPAALASGDNVAVLFANATRPQSVAVVPSAGGKPRVIFPILSAEFPLEDQVTPENVILKAPDGLAIHNQLFLPKDLKPGEKRPGMIFVHGGPQRQMLLGYHYRHFYHMAYAFDQYLANQGYIVMSVNYRGGIGYGKKFRNAPKRGGQGNSEYQDVLVAGQYLRDHAQVDAKRVGIWGLSYGGLLTAQALARNSDIFAAGVDLAGVHIFGSSVDAKDVSYQSSPISQIDKWKSPVLLIHGDDDRNVAFSQTTGLVQLLRAHNVPHELIIFPDDVHDSLLHHRWIQSFNATDDFFKRHMKQGN